MLRLETIAAKQVVGSAQGDTYSSWIRWYDVNNEVIETNTFTFLADRFVSQNTITGTVPVAAAAYEIQLGFDTPNIEINEFVAIRSVSLEIVDSEKSYISPGEFVSSIFEGGDVSWKAETPEGTEIRLQISKADFVPDTDMPGEFTEFIGPDGTANSYYTEPFEVSAAFVRYKAVLIPNGTTTPTLTSVTVGNKKDGAWKNGGDVDPPRVKLAGVYAQPSKDTQAALEFEVSDDSYVCSSSVVIVVNGGTLRALFLVKRPLLDPFAYVLNWKRSFQKGSTKRPLKFPTFLATQFWQRAIS